MSLSQSLDIQIGHPSPIGPQISRDGVNFSIYVKDTHSITLKLFEFDTSQRRAIPLVSINLDHKLNRTGNAWHVFASGLPEKVLYGYVIDNSPLLLDPYAPEIWSGGQWGEPNIIYEGQQRFYSPLGLIDRAAPFDWEGDTPLQIPPRDLVIYELHVRGFTKHSGSNVREPGTYSAIAEKIPHLKRLGINAVELMPVFEFNELSYCRTWVATRMTLMNYWGYSPVSFFAPMNRYASSHEPGGAGHEFKTMVKELHKNSIEVILDVVFNHTAESENKESIYSFRGLDPKAYYLIDGNNHDQNFSGCGHTFNSNHPVSIELIISALRHWVSEYHVDGFRFDLASALTRGTDGSPMDDPPLIKAMNADPVLNGVKLIAEPWDAAGLYHVGSFPQNEGRWIEWNGKYRDDCRDFLKGTQKMKGAFASRLCGSEDIYHSYRSPANSLNFITCHDGFTLSDMVSYNDKHNEANGEDNRDGTNDNRSWNCGLEGQTKNAQILKLRERRMKNYMAALLLSQGIPMIRMGDEYGHTQNGNNNTWCQDNNLSWFQWAHADLDRPIPRFMRSLIEFRNRHNVLRKPYFLSPRDVHWHGTRPFTPNWNADDRLVVLTLIDHDQSEDLYIAFNSSHRRKKLNLAKPPEDKIWYKIIDTFQDSPADFIYEDDAVPYKDSEQLLMPYSVLLFKAR